MYTDGSKIISVDIEREMKKSYLDYSMSVIVGRALPDVRDGLKPVHRRILYTMHERGLTPDKAYRKCADIVGTVLGSYHPHGDASVYDALVRMAQDFSLRYPLVDGHGNFGSVDGDPPAAYRYTESKMAKISSEMLTDIDKDTVNYAPNYDDRLEEPVVLPSRFPNLLVNGSTGIAVGMATNIPPHNLKEVIDAVCLLIDNPEAEMIDIMECIKGPDFPTGGIIMGYSGIRAAYATGRGKITLRGRAEIEEENNRFRIVVTELPYAVNKARLLESIANLVKDKRIDGISDLRDESDRDGMRMVIELKRDANPQVVLNQLYRYSQLQETVGVILLALANGEPKVMNLKEILEHYIAFQSEVIYRRTQFELKKARDRAHILEGLKIAIDNIDEVISIIRSKRTIAEAKDALIERFGLSDLQSQAIVSMRLGQLAGLEIEKIEEEYAALMAKIKNLEEILADNNKVLAIVKEEILAIRTKYGDDRRTEIMAVSGEVDIEDLIPVEDCVLTMTHNGYIKRQSVDTYHTQHRGGRGLSGMQTREEDFIEELFICSSHDYVLFFTSRGRVLRLKCYEVPEGSRVSKGSNIVNLLPIESDEKVMSMIRISDFEEGKYLVFITRKGIVKRTDLMAYNTARKSGVIALSVDEDDELTGVRLTSGEDELIIATRQGQAIRFPESNVRKMGRTARGVKGISLSADDEVVSMARIRDGATLLTVTEKGQGRRTDISEYRLQSRGGKGIINYRVSPQKGLIAGARVVDEDDDVIMITSEGVIIRLDVGEINIQSRYAGGVRVMRVDEGAHIVTVARAPKEDEEELMENESGSEQTTEANDNNQDSQPQEENAESAVVDDNSETEQE